MSFGPIPVNYIGDIPVLWQASGPPDGWHIPIGAHRLTIGTWDVSFAAVGQPRWCVYWDFEDGDNIHELTDETAWYVFSRVMEGVAEAVASNRTAG